MHHDAMRGYRLATSPGGFRSGSVHGSRIFAPQYPRTARSHVENLPRDMAEGRGHRHAVILACNAMTHKMAKEAGTFVARDPDATRREIPGDIGSAILLLLTA